MPPCLTPRARRRSFSPAPGRPPPEDRPPRGSGAPGRERVRKGGTRSPAACRRRAAPRPSRAGGEHRPSARLESGGRGGDRARGVERLGPYSATSSPAARPAGSPASASRKAPVHTETTRSALGAGSPIRRTTAGSGSIAPRPPGTRRVWAGSTWARSSSGSKRSPLDVRTGPPPSPAVVIRYVPGRPVTASAPANTSRGPCHVQALHSFTEDDQHAVGFHAVQPGSRPTWQQ